MPELPEIVVYLDALESRVVGQSLERIRIRTPSLLKTFDPPVSDLEGRRVTGLRRVGKRVVFELEGGFFAVVPPHGERALSVEGAGRRHPQETGSCGFRLSERHAPSHRGEYTQEGLAPCPAG